MRALTQGAQQSPRCQAEPLRVQGGVRLTRSALVPVEALGYIAPRGAFKP